MNGDIFARRHFLHKDSILHKDGFAWKVTVALRVIFEQEWNNLNKIKYKYNNKTRK